MFKNLLFKDLTAAEKEEIIDVHTPLFFDRNEIIFEEGNASSGFYLVQSGIIKRYISGRKGKESIFDLNGANEIFGHRMLFTKDDHFDSASTLTPASVIYIPKEFLVRLLKNNQNAMFQYITMLSEDCIKQIRHSQVLTQYSLRERTAYYLLYIQSKNLDPNDWSIDISREDLANLLGTVKESAVRIMHEFKKENRISSSGKRINIIDADYLKSVAQILISTSMSTTPIA